MRLERLSSCSSSLLIFVPQGFSFKYLSVIIHQTKQIKTNKQTNNTEMISSQLHNNTITSPLSQKRSRSMSPPTQVCVKQARLEPSPIRLNQLPVELLSLVFEHLEVFDLFTLAQVCKQFRIAIDTKSLWRHCTFKLHQDLIHQTHISAHTVEPTKKDSFRKRALASYRNMAHVWVLKSYPDHMKIRLTYEPPSETFLIRNQLSPRLNCIRTLNLSCSADSVTQDVLINLLKCLPQLVDVDLSCCHLIGDLAIKELVSHPKRSQALQSLKLNKCFGLSYKSMGHIVDNCINLKHLDISESSGAADAYGLPMLKTLAQLKLESLDLSSSDLLMERNFVELFNSLSELGPKQCSLNTLELSRNFHITGNVLNSIYKMTMIDHSQSKNSLSQIMKPSQKHQLKIIVKDCEQIVNDDVKRCKDRLQFAIQTNPEYSKRFDSVDLIDNTKLKDHSFESIRDYIGAYM